MFHKLEIWVEGGEIERAKVDERWLETGGSALKAEGMHGDSLKLGNFAVFALGWHTAYPERP